MKGDFGIPIGPKEPEIPIKIKCDPSWSDFLSPPEAWCLGQFGHACKSKTSWRYWTFYFHTKEEAMLFKLTWGGEDV